MAKTRGFRYRVDRAAQGFGPLRAADAFGLRHPVLDKLALLPVGVMLGAGIGVWTNSILGGVLGFVVGTPLFYWRTRVNHRRRTENGTSAQYEPPPR